MVNITKEALYNATISVAETNIEIRRILGINQRSLVEMKKRYDINRE